MSDDAVSDNLDMIDERTTALGLLHYAHSYATAASSLAKQRLKGTHPDAPVRYLLSHSLELYLKAHLLHHGVSLNRLRSREFGHDLVALSVKAVSNGLALSDQQLAAFELANDSILDRYIVTGSRSVLLPSTMLALCGDLHDQIGPSIYDREGLRRRLSKPT